MSSDNDDQLILTAQQREESREMRWVDGVTRLLDTKFRIPGTQTRFGIDFLLGIIPGVGDVTSLGVSGVLVATMAKNGASPRLVARMLINVVLDAVVGTVPILGNLFDLFYKANSRNLILMREYYEQDKHQGSVWPIVLCVVATILLIVSFVVWLLVVLFRYLWQLL
ncbi:DUF4112 domain-containing protein [Stieleria marina]|uniref:DUF4112 domain-containing protein n=1 Tax=Stieleria marina TaxID=1930275 RepID=A0A517NVV5_9BACT|nr:hypothetical protein K239x_32540 [Planctomycetes bacterium K23_9]